MAQGPRITTKKKNPQKDILEVREGEKLYSLDELEDDFYGEKGTPERDRYEFELSLELFSEKIKELRKAKNLTQEQLGALIGVQRAQIAKLENGYNNVTLETINKVFKALNAKVKFQVEVEPSDELALHI
jgi:HTH-type transcriptional regulator / antitoxin HipB